MRFVTFAADDGSEQVGVLDNAAVRAFPPGTSMLDLLRAEEDLTTLGQRLVDSPGTAQPLTGLRLRAPVPEPPTVRDYMAFEQHVEGVVRLADPTAQVPDRWYEAPAFYFTNPYAVQGPHDDVAVPPGCTAFDLELEIAAVVGRPGRDVHPDDAGAHIAGYTIMIDWSARDLQFAEMEVRLGPTKGKDSATTLGPVLVTPDELEHRRSGTGYDLAMTARVNGQIIGQDRWSSMAYSFGDLLAYASRGTEVRPGDVLGSGTCGGGCLAELWGRHGREVHRPLLPGDTVDVQVEGLGQLSVRVVAGRTPTTIPRARRRS